MVTQSSRNPALTERLRMTRTIALNFTLDVIMGGVAAVSYTHLRAHETDQ